MTIVIICGLSLAWGFAIACLIFSMILPKSHDIGNSIGEAEDFKIKISYDVYKELEYNKEQVDEIDLFCLRNFENIDTGIEEPDPDKVVERMLKRQFEPEDITSTYVDG